MKRLTCKQCGNIFGFDDDVNKIPEYCSNECIAAVKRNDAWAKSNRVHKPSLQQAQHFHTAHAYYQGEAKWMRKTRVVRG
jgi:hypothetical protein